MHDLHMIERPLVLRITLIAPPAGVLFALQEGDVTPVEAQRSDSSDLTFEVLVRVAEGVKGARFLGPFVRREGDRRFVYLRVGRLAGDPDSPWDRRIKIFITDIPAELVRLAAEHGAGLKASFPGTMKDGSPACATQRPLDGWTLT